MMLRDTNTHRYRRGANPNRNPLRKIVGGFRGESGVWIEELECGHEQHQREDFIGPTNAYRRRCWRCGKAAKDAALRLAEENR